MSKVETKDHVNQEQNLSAIDIETELSLIQSFISLGLMVVEELLYREVDLLAGSAHQPKTNGNYTGYRWGKNSGSVYLGDTKSKIAVPRVRDRRTAKEIPLDSNRLLKAKP